MPILIAEYDPAWPARFAQEEHRLREALGPLALRVEHVGSTSVPDLAGKPVIDIQVSVANLSTLAPYQRPLESIGYTLATIPFPYFHRPSDWPHTHHVHLREAGSRDELRTLAFRDWLRSHPDDRNAYELLKRALAVDADTNSAEGRFRYSDAKTQFIRAVEHRAGVCRDDP
jgi:GrpB-like predicted nucleotidyltransferase (UPF0157 family)